MNKLRRHIMIQLGGGAPIPANNQIIYKSKTGSALDLSGICNAALISQEIVGEFIIATFDNNVTTIYNYTSQQMTYIDFPQTCKTFGRTAFDGSYYLERIIFRASNYTFGNYCFSISSAAKFIVTLYATTPPIRRSWAIGGNPFSKKPTIEVPVGCAEAYRNSPYWSGYQIVEMS